MNTIKAKVQRIEPTETSKVVFVNFKGSNGELKLELPEKINYFSTDDEIEIRFVENKEPETDDKLFLKAYIFTVEEQDDKKVIYMSIGGLSFKLILNKDVELPILKPRKEVYIGFK
ncbi:MAG: hypothetical protein GF329_20115 [Candidatus Lokiarchaeota archaeon]|nr:hypothetical protein [Candidatus Lokiarchaeota archaeon]